jgi:hypothetical protein
MQLLNEPKYYTSPHDTMFPGFPQPYLHASQSKYHNLGQVNVLPKDRYGVYVGKRGGFVGDYGLRQNGCGQNDYPYPLDQVILDSRYNTRDRILGLKYRNLSSTNTY